MLAHSPNNRRNLAVSATPTIYAHASNNLAFIYYKLRQYAEAHDYLERARIILERIGNLSNLAQADETRARILLAEGHYKDAEAVINEVVSTLQGGGEQAFLTEALTTKATILARLGETKRSISFFNYAIRTGEEAGAHCSAGLAALGLIEEHGSQLSVSEIFNAYRTADRLLAQTEDDEAINRLRVCAGIFTSRLCERSPKFNLQKAVLEYEAHFIQQALEEEHGSVTRAAKKLGITHQGLSFILATRQQKLFAKRLPPKKRRRSLMKKS